MKPKNQSIALIGCGYWGKNILRNLYELGALHTACDSDLDILSAHKKQFPCINYTTSFKQALKHPAVKAVVIATPAATHYNLIKEALLAGKDVFVEKPLALTVNEGEELVELAKKKKAILMVGHILQYHPAIKKIKELISSGAIGKVQYIYSNRLNIGKLRTEENILWSFAPHDISIILSLLGEEPVKVSAFGGSYLNKGVCDATLTTLDFLNEVKAHVFVSWLHPYKEQKLIIVGSKAMAVFDDVSKEKLFLYPHKIEWRNGKIPIAQKADYQVIPIESGEPLKLELEHFINCIKTRKAPDTDGAEGIRVLRVLEAAENSLNIPVIASEAKAQSCVAQQNPCHSENLGPVIASPACPEQSRGKGAWQSNVHIHPTSCIDSNVTIGKDTKVWHFSHILKNSKIGKSCIIGQNVMIGPDAVIGNRCKVQNNVSIYTGVTLEDDVFCGPSCVFTNVYNPRAFIERKDEFRPTLVKKGATIGANATIICGITIGKYALIGAGAVVKKDVPDYAVAAGVPAKLIGWICKCGIKLIFTKNKAKCQSCGLKYRLNEKGLVPLISK
jgi:UDP-2-acetamido-3-amino-2,3-dideoxy-glucuronate N-acetyltransferase